jgi:hypothetical protein
MSEEFVLGASSTGDSEGGDRPERVLVPEGFYTAEVVRCGVETKPWVNEETGEKDIKKVVFAFKILDEPYEDQWVFGETPLTFTNHPDCKLRGWVKELLGQDELAVGFKFNTDSLVGLQAKVSVAHTKKERAYVGDIMRLETEAALASDIF